LIEAANYEYSRPQRQSAKARDRGLAIARSTESADKNIGLTDHVVRPQNTDIYSRTGKRAHGFPIPRHKDRPAIIVTACITHGPFNFLLSESRVSIRAVCAPLGYGGCKYIVKLIRLGGKHNPAISNRFVRKAKSLVARF
jgi:hypothetical protein